MSLEPIRARLKSLRVAASGMVLIFTTEPNARVHLLATVLVTVAGWFFDVTKSEWTAIVICIGFVIASEAFNTALETLANRVTRNHDPEIAATKDIAAAGVLLAAITSAIVGAIIFVPRLVTLIRDSAQPH